jgi:hypothetical protein
MEEKPKTENPKTRVQTQLRTRDTRLDRCLHSLPYTMREPAPA